MHRKLLSPMRAEEVRHKIRASLIVNKLEKHVLENEEMSSSQISAALGLLKKCVPDLANIEHSMNQDSPLVIQVLKFSKKNNE